MTIDGLEHPHPRKAKPVAEPVHQGTDIRIEPVFFLLIQTGQVCVVFRHVECIGEGILIGRNLFDLKPRQHQNINAEPGIKGTAQAGDDFPKQPRHMTRFADGPGRAHVKMLHMAIDLIKAQDETPRALALLGKTLGKIPGKPFETMGNMALFTDGFGKHQTHTIGHKGD